MPINFDDIGREFLYQIAKQRVIEPCRVDSGIDMYLKNEIKMSVEDVEHLAVRIKEGGKSQIIALKCFSEALYKGPKVLKLKDDDVEYFENHNLNLTLADYSQPFETLIIEFPEKYRESRQVIEEYDHPWKDRFLYVSGKGEVSHPDCATIYHNKKEQFLMITIRMDNNVIYTFLNEWLNEPLEDSFKACAGNRYKDSMAISNAEEVLYIKFMKVALNAALFMDEYGVKCDGPKNPSHYERLKRQAKKGNDTAKAQKELRTYPIHYSFQQEIKLNRTINNHTAATGGVGGTAVIVSPHWRRGFWKMQPYGPHNSLRKRIHIAAVYVNAHLLIDNDLSKTGVTYRE